MGGTKELLNLPSHHLGAASAAPNSAALSGSIPKAPGSAGGYLRVPSMNDSLEVEVLYPA